MRNLAELYDNGLMDDLLALLESWVLVLRSERRSPETIRAYHRSVSNFITDCKMRGVPPALTPVNVRSFMVGMMDAGAAVASIRLRLAAVKRFAQFVADEENIDVSKILAIRPPVGPQKPVPALTDAEVLALLKACPGANLRDKRDKAMLMLFAETGLRASELLGLEVPADIDLERQLLVVNRGKGNKARRVKFSAESAAAVGRYMRARTRSGWGAGALWVGRSGPLSYTGLVTTLKSRAQMAGVTGFHPHRLRHTAAVRWLRSGGSETGLMAQAGWASREMIGRYVNTAAEELAATEFDRLNLGFG